MRDIESTGKTILGSAIRVHSHLGPGLLESAYQKCLAYELQKQGLTVVCELPMPLSYENIFLDVGYRVDMLVGDHIIVENKSVEKILPVHEAQLLTYLRLTNCPLGFLLNWNVILLKDGIKRMVNRLNFPTP